MAPGKTTTTPAKTTTPRDPRHPEDRSRNANAGKDREGGDERGRGTFEAGPAPEDLTRGAPPKPVKRYSQAG